MYVSVIHTMKSYTGFRLVPKIGDLEWPWTALFYWIR